MLTLGAWSWPWWTPSAAPLTLGVIALAGIAALGRRTRAAALALLAGALLLGALACALLRPAPEIPTNAAVRGRVSAASARTMILETASGELRVRSRTPPPPVGTMVAVWTRPIGRRAILPGASDDRLRLLRAHQTEVRARGWIALGGPTGSRSEERLAGCRHSGLLTALVTGRRGGVPEEVIGLLERTGTRHLLAISGLHIALVSGLVYGLLRMPMTIGLRRGRIIAAAISAATAIAYADRVGWPISARRATLMVVAAALALALGRRPRPWSLLGLGAAGVIASDPAAVGEGGFLLSFGAVMGILLYAPRLTRLLPPDAPSWVRWVVTSVGVTVGAMAGTLPLTAWWFQELPAVSPLTNLIATPLVGGIALPAALLGAQVEGPVGWLGLAIADAALDLALGALRMLDRPPMVAAVGPLGACLLAAVLLPGRLGPPVLLLGWLLLAAPHGEPGRLVVTFLAVGQGDAALVEWPDGRRWLIDAGPGETAVLRWLRRRRIRSLDAVFLSHPHPDHMNGMAAVLEEVAVGALWTPRPPWAHEREFRTLWSRAWRRGVVTRGPGDTGATVLHPLDGWQAVGRSRVNEESLVLRVEHGSRSFLFTGDIERQAEAHLIATADPIDVLKVAHHGSRTSSELRYLERLQPEIAVVSCGEGNRYGHPTAEALGSLMGAALLRTDRDGTVEISTDGVDLRVRTWRSRRGWRDVERQPWTPEI